jgi:hypothetical protein
MKRPIRAHFCLSREERKMLIEVGRKLGFTRSDTVRMLIRREHERLCGTATTPEKAVA